MATHIFDYTKMPAQVLSPQIVSQLTFLHEVKGRQEVFISAEPDVLKTMLEMAKIQSTKASNKIEGIYTSDERLEAIMQQKTEPRGRSEQEIAGYRNVLSTIHESYEYITARPNNILQLHRDLYSYSGTDAGGKFKNSDNVIAETGKDGKTFARFVPVPAFETAAAMEDLCTAFNDAVSKGEHDPLVLVPMFVLDFLCIHPFNDGNGRMSRLLTLLLLYRAGYLVGKYISIEMLIEQSKATYYEALKDSSTAWHENKNSYVPFVGYMLSMVTAAYKEFERRVEHLDRHKLNKAERVRNVFDTRLGKISKADILIICPDISTAMVERTLKALLDEGYIEKKGTGRATFYVKK